MHHRPAGPARSAVRQPAASPGRLHGRGRHQGRGLRAQHHRGTALRGQAGGAAVRRRTVRHLLQQGRFQEGRRPGAEDRLDDCE